MTDDAARIRQALDEAGVAGSDDFGHVANNLEYLAPSQFDEGAATPVLLRLLPTITDPWSMTAIAGHLCRSVARPTAFEPLLVAFRWWAPRDRSVGWALGNALATTSSAKHLDVILEIAANEVYGSSRQMIVFSLWRYRKDDRVMGLLVKLVEDPDVSAHAMSSLRRTVGNADSLPILVRLRDESPNPSIRKQAAKAIQLCLKAVAKSESGHGVHGLGTRPGF